MNKVEETLNSLDQKTAEKLKAIYFGELSISVFGNTPLVDEAEVSELKRHKLISEQKKHETTTNETKFIRTVNPEFREEIKKFIDNC